MYAKRNLALILIANFIFTTSIFEGRAAGYEFSCQPLVPIVYTPPPAPAPAPTQIQQPIPTTAAQVATAEPADKLAKAKDQFARMLSGDFTGATDETPDFGDAQAILGDADPASWLSPKYITMGLGAIIIAAVATYKFASEEHKKAIKDFIAKTKDQLPQWMQTPCNYIATLAQQAFATTATPETPTAPAAPGKQGRMGRAWELAKNILSMSLAPYHNG